MAQPVGVVLVTVIDGAAVRVSLVCFAPREAGLPIALDGRAALRINADLTADRVDLGSTVRRLRRNADVSFMGNTKNGPFDVAGELAREWLARSGNPNGRGNSDVLKPWVNGMDLVRRPADIWIIDFGTSMGEAEAELYEMPFAHVAEHVRPIRVTKKVPKLRERWWQHEAWRPGMWKALDDLQRFMATPRVAKHRLFLWLSTKVCPDCQLIVIARDDDTTFGVLHSRFHEAWSLRLGSSLEDRPRYTPTTTFETFPFPKGLSPDIPAEEYAEDPRAVAIAVAVRDLVGKRDRWLNPSDLMEWIDEPVSGYPKRAVPRNEAAAKELEKLTLTKLYNERPPWLARAHAELDAAVAEAYGWQADIPEEEALRRLLELNQASG